MKTRTWTIESVYNMPIEVTEVEKTLNVTGAKESCEKY